MDHRITTAIVVCVGGTLAFTLLLALFSSTVPSGADASTAAADHAAAPAPVTRLRVILRQLDSAGYRFRRQHGGTDPDFAAHPKWDQFLLPTDVRGQVVAAPAKDLVGPRPRTYGPYLSAIPVNPMNGRADVAVTDRPADAGDRVPGGPAGFVYSRATQQFSGTDETGTTVTASSHSP